MTFDEVLDQVRELLRQRGRLSYGALKRRFDLDEAYLEDLKAELIDAEQVARDEDGKVLAWTSASPVSSSTFQVPRSTQPHSQVSGSTFQVSGSQPPTPSTQHPGALRFPLNASRAEAERRQLTVLFGDLVDSTKLSALLDPEEYREVVRAYHETCAGVISRYGGHTAQHLGDGLLVYFSYPAAHEDDAQRAVRTGLEILAGLQSLNARLPSTIRTRLPHPIQVRIGIHTGLVVIGEIGSSEKREILALGETPNLAARIQGLAEPNTVMVSAATQRLIEGYFESQPFGSHRVKGIETPIAVYHVQSERQSVSPLAGRATLTPLVGREQEVGLLLDRWEQVKEGRGQVVLLSGEPGIGKSRLAYTLREHVTAEGSLLFEARCSPYHQQSALYPLIDVLQRILLLHRQEPEADKVQKVERALVLYDMQETVPLFTALLSLPTPPQYPPLNLTPQKQKERTLQALVQLLLAQAERQATVSVWEDLHWADPSSLEFLTLLIEQIPTTKLLLVLTFRPEFTPPWKPRSHISQLVLNRLGKRQVEAMIEKVTAGKELSAEVIEQIRLKTDGVPLFVEELTKSVIESVESVGAMESPRQAPLQLAIPATLQEALLARLDRLSTARQIAQLGATLGREFSHELLQAVAPMSESDLHTALEKLVEAEILYQRGIGEQARYFFKHALIQDIAYQSLLKSSRQQYHQQIARVLEERFPETKEMQPEILAHHYTRSGNIQKAVDYLQLAGQQTAQRSANAEAITHLTTALELLTALPPTPELVQQELGLQTTLGSVLIAAKGYAAPEVGQAYARARELCQQSGEAPQLGPVLHGLWGFYIVRAEYRTAYALAEQLLNLAESQYDTTCLIEAHWTLGATLVELGELSAGHAHLEQSLALYNPQEHRSLAFAYGHDPGMSSLSFIALALWRLGYPDQALKSSQAAVSLAQEVAHPFSLAYALTCAAWCYQLRREEQRAQEQAEAGMALCTEHGVPIFLALGAIFRGWALAEQGQRMEGIVQIRQGWADLQATGVEVFRPWYLALLAEAYGKTGQGEEGLAALAEALAEVDKTGERWYEAELYRLKGELVLQSAVHSLRPLASDPQSMNK
jgi:class 3 adenylate cyclase/predicted ATPase